MKRLLLLLSLSLSIFGCDRYEYVHVHSYVYSYVDYTRLELDTLNNGSNFKIPGSYFKIAMIPKDINCLYQVNRNDEMYEYYCELHKDTTYPEHKISTTDFITSRFTVYDYSSVDITASIDWDSSHPAGQSLNDLVHFVSMSPYKYILSGYKTLSPNPLNEGTASKYYMDVFESELKNYNSEIPVYPVDKKCSNLNEDDMVLLDFIRCHALAYLVFETRPARPCTVTVKLTATTGKVFSASVKVD